MASELDCNLLELDGAQLLNSRTGKPDYPEELIEMRATALRQPKDVIFGRFHVWLQSDVN